MKFGARSIISTCLLLGLLACAKSNDEVEIVVNTGIPVRPRAPVNLNQNLMNLMSVTLGQDCYQDQVQLILFDTDTNQFIFSKKILLRTNLADVITYGNNVADVDFAVNHLLYNSALDEPLTIHIPKNKRIEVGLVGAIYKPTDDDNDGVCDHNNNMVTYNYWANEQNMSLGRYNHTATTLKDGRILVSGGTGTSFLNLNNSQIYNPETNTWSGLIPFADPAVRAGHTATLLNDGRVLVVGGETIASIPATTAEIFNPTSNTWSSVAGPTNSRFNHSATLLHGGANEGKVLIAGGRNAVNLVNSLITEIFDPSTNTWTAGPIGFNPRQNHTATLLSNGTLMAIGGGDLSFNPSTLVDMYNPAALPTWTPGPPLTSGARMLHTANTLPNGNVVVVGGISAANISISNVDMFSPTTLLSGTWTGKASLSVARYKHSTTVLPDGELLVTGGVLDNNPPMNNVSISDPAISVWSPSPAFGIGRGNHTATLLSNGNVLIIGGKDGSSTPMMKTEINQFYSPSQYSTSMIGHAVVDSNSISSGVLELNIQLLHTNPTANYSAQMIANPSRYHDWIEIVDKGFSPAAVGSAFATLDTISYLGLPGYDVPIKHHVNTTMNAASSIYIPNIFPLTLEFNYTSSVASGCMAAMQPCSGRYRAIVNSSDSTGLSLNATLIQGTQSTEYSPPPTISPSAGFLFRIKTY